MDLTKYSKYLSSDLYNFLTDLEKAAGVEVSKLPSTSSAVAGTRYIVKDDDGAIEYYKSSDGTFYALGSSSEEGSKQIELQATDTNIQWKYTDEDEWTDLIPVESLKGDDGANGSDGESAYVYIAYASDEDGTDFTLTYDSSLDYIAVLSTNTSIETPTASDFTGLWKKYQGDDGSDGVGVPSGGSSGQVLMKTDDTDYNTEWVDQSGGSSTASTVSTDTSNFNNNLSAADDTVQKALETLDEIIGSGSGVTFNSVSSLTDLIAISFPSTGDWAYVASTTSYYVYLNGYWRTAGSMAIVLENYGENAHYDASQITGASDGDYITEWTDTSGSGYNAEAVSSGPVYKTNIINGLPVLRFSESSDANIMRIPGKIFGNTETSELTIITVAKPANDNHNPIISTQIVGGGGWIMKYSPNWAFQYYQEAASGVCQMTLADGWYVIWARRHSSTNIELGYNSTTNQTTTTPDSYTPNTTDTHTQIGSYDNGGHAYYRFNGDIAEIIIFESAISDTLLGTIISDLKTKYDIT